ncbi:aminoglycoside phosphotransferase family protein [Streptomyces sp. DSM 44915]|uniref:Aminoglycoside phosphotransferase family protein n=1 Tax=Streptomyces chisholmiae TaxID=3075540 RepID=A0ABU2JU73_9ACTN|nr:aminoglycoside phosphotransferase family protein [Streptomyces sp. DSM 44915]MDT0268505.1 aminoglycoside phosphotransferase family protein [Streptomyces sp. DSM 44915]
MSVHRVPAAEVSVSPRLVRELLTDQHPDLAGLDIVVLANGWDNVVCRLGRDHLVRLPRRAASAVLVVNEQRWLPELAAHLPLPVPAPVRVGRPGRGYPWSWSVVPFLPGEIAARTPPADPGAAARALGEFLAELHRPAPSDAPGHPARGIPLAGRTARLMAQLPTLADPVERAAALRLWEYATAAPAWAGPPGWLHGDLHPANLLVDQGRLSAVLDFGDLTAGDPATDLAVAWMLLPAPYRAEFRDAYGRADDATWVRARGWALALALVFLAHSADSPLMARIGRRTMDAVLDRDAGSDEGPNEGPAPTG